MPRSPGVRVPSHPRYLIERTLGSGGAGSVYLARDRLDDGRQVALKVCHHEIAPEQILREFRVLRELRHPGIARAYDFGRLPDSGRTYFTMEYVAGPDLERESSRLRGKATRRSLGPLLDIFLQITAALRYVHHKGLLHLDLKPANAVFWEGRVKLIDFGLFQNLELEESRRPRGTAYYTAPEVLDGAAVDCRADLYSLGVTLYRSFTGQYPISGRSLAEIASNHRRTPPRPPRGLPEELSRIILKLLAKSPRHRFQSAGELEEALRALSPQAPHAPAQVVFEEPDFVGRKRELDVFFTWLDGIRKEEGPRILAVEGERGIGKSRFVDACITEMAGLGVQVVSVSSFAENDPDGLRRLIDKIAVLYPLTRQRRARFRFLLTSLGISSNNKSRTEMAQLDLDRIRARALQEALEFLAECAVEPLVIVLEDLHRADVQLKDLVRRLRDGAFLSGIPRRLGILVTSCPGTDLGRGFAKDGPDARTIRLKRLKRSEVLKALESVDPALESRTASRLATSSRGNPGLLVHLVYQALGEDRRLPATPSTDLAGLLRQRLRLLEEPERSIVLYLDLLKRPAAEPLLRELTGLSSAAFRRTRLTLLRAGLLRGNRKGYFLDQDLCGEPALPDSEPDAVRAAHETIGRFLSKDRRRLHEAAHHLLRSGRVDRGLALARRAGTELRAAGRVEDALVLYDEALPHASDPELRAHFLEQLGDLEDKSGRFTEAGSSYDHLLQQENLSPRDRLRVLRKRGGVYQRSGENEAARRAFEEALQLLEKADDLEEHLYLLNELAALYLFRGEFPRSTTFANRGLEILRSRGAARLGREPRALHALNFHSIAGHILLRQFEYDRAVAEFLRGLELSKRVGSLANTALILNNLGIAYNQANRLPEALRVYRRAADLAEKMGDETALFSIQCNVAGIRSRRGEMRAAVEILEGVEEMPHPRRSKRARLFFLHSKGLVERLALGDARTLWEESIRLADEIPDPLFASFGRVYLLENEIFEGRWAAARQLVDTLETIRTKDPRLEQAIASRRAYLEALCGHAEAARTLAARVLPAEGSSEERISRAHHGELWDHVLAASALMEAGDFEGAERALERVRDVFARTRQQPGALECSLLLAEASLRRREPRAATKRLQEARKALSLHDTSQGSRAAAIRIPFLEARLGMQSARANRTYVSDRLVDAAGNLPFGAASETVWLLDLTALENDEPGARRKVTLSRQRFAGELLPDDRKRYLARDHRARLGLAGSEEAKRRGEEPAEGMATKRLGALSGLRQVRDAGRALDLVLEACGLRRGAIFLDDEGRLATSRGLEGRGKKSVERLRQRVLRLGSGSLESGFSAEIGAPSRQRLGVLYVEDPEGTSVETEEKELQEFLQLAGQLIADVLPPSSSHSRTRLETTALLMREAEKTRTLVSSTFVGSGAPAMQELWTLIQRTRDSHLPVLLTGESGVGKDHLARWIHALSPCRDGPFLGLDCAAIPEGLLEADLFGHEAGAFTGARRAKQGYLVAADGGSVYLDHVHSLSLETQAKLLRVLEEGQFRPLGSRRTTKVEVRFIASTQRELKELSSRGEFRSDLYFRLAGICLAVPPLRERVEDIPLLIEHFQHQIPAPALELTAEAVKALKSYSWPGNVRELEALVRRLALTAEGPVGESGVLHALGIEDSPATFPRWIFEGRNYDQLLGDVKREYLLYLFERFEGDLNRIARELGTTKRNVYLRFSQAGLRPVELRSRAQRG